MTARKKKTFSKEFKAEITKLVLDGGKKCADVAAEHEVPVASVYSWVKQARTLAADHSAGKPLSTEEHEVRRLRREVKELAMENAFLKKTSAYFASQKS